MKFDNPSNSAGDSSGAVNPINTKQMCDSLFDDVVTEQYAPSGETRSAFPNPASHAGIKSSPDRSSYISDFPGAYHVVSPVVDLRIPVIHCGTRLCTSFRGSSTHQQSNHN